MLKKVLVGAIALALSMAMFGCSSSSAEQPEKINVVGMTLGSACAELSEAGWSPTPVDETLYSSYVPGAWENGEKQYSSCIVTRVEFKESQSAGRGYATKPSCKVYFESNEQPELEELYDLDQIIYLDWYKKLKEDLETNGPSEEVQYYTSLMYSQLLEYDEDKIPNSRKDDHQKLIGRYEALLERMG